MNKPHKITLKPEAEKDLSKIYQYSLAKFGKHVALSYIKDIDTAFNNLVNYPDSGHYCHNIKQNLSKYIINSHVVFFYKKDLSIDVIRILHQSQDYTHKF